MLGKELSNKFRSKKGASILFALFVLLICTVIGSVILTAGTAAAGRVNRAAKSDGRYYSLMSASELLKDAIDGETVRLVRTKTSVTTDRDTVTVDDGGVAHRTDTSSTTDVSYDTQIRRKAEGLGWAEVRRGDAVASDAAIDLLIGSFYGVESESAWLVTVPAFAGTAEPHREYRISFEGTAAPENVAEALEVAVNLDVKSDRTIELILTSPADGTQGGVYKEKLIFDAQTEELPLSVSTHSAAPIATGSENSYVQTTVTTVTEEKVTTLKWVFDRIESGF